MLSPLTGWGEGFGLLSRTKNTGLLSYSSKEHWIISTTARRVPILLYPNDSVPAQIQPPPSALSWYPNLEALINGRR